MSVNDFNLLVSTVLSSMRGWFDILNGITIGPLTIWGWIVGFFAFNVVIILLYKYFFGFNGKIRGNNNN